MDTALWESIEEQLSSFDVGEREAALEALPREAAPVSTASENVNMHMHSFFSFNAFDWSPIRIAWEARKAGLYAAAVCDFDVLDGVREFLDAGTALGLRGAAHLETRAFLPEFRDKEISSPGEPGVTYIMGCGFAGPPAQGSKPEQGLEAYRRRAGERNRALIGRVNAHLQDVTVDYERDVMPLTPAGNPTERHLIRAYLAKARDVFEHAGAVAAFWSSVLGVELDEVVEILAEPPKIEELVRSKLVKRGGVGYEQPSEETFPAVDEFVSWVLSCDAIPTITWLDGTSEGEADPRVLFECLAAKGCAALNIVPDRNWNVSDPEDRTLKVACLNAAVAEAERMQLPVNIGTELNKLGLPFVDDLAGDVLRTHKAVFLRGARLMVGHSLLLRYADFSYVGEAARIEYPDVADRNAFFERVGAQPPVTAERARRLEDMGPRKALAALRASAT